MSNRPYSGRDEQKLMTELWDPAIADDPEKFVLFAFPWGKEGTPLHDKKEPRSWQRDELQQITQYIKDCKSKIAIGENPDIYQSATASGRGVGKSALTAWLNLWMMSTRLGATCINTANTEAQLKSRTWAELGKWHTLSINSHWFDKQALSLKPAEWFETALKRQLKVDTGYYYSAAQLWSEENPDAFAGVHNFAGVLVIFDEASGIPEPIWTVTEGFFTDPTANRFWFAFSNPRRNTGSFFECFHKNRKYWKRRNLDSRTVEGTDHTYLNQIVEKHGEDSDAARIEVKGQFPKQGDRQFISREIIEQAAERELLRDDHAALIMGVDPARFGDDSTVIRFRQGRDARSIPAIKLKGKDNMEVANECAYLIQKFNPDAVCIDAGNGTGIIDRLREMNYKVHEVWFGSKSSEEEYANHRTELWGRMREWLRGGCIDNDSDLLDDLAGPEYKFQGAGDKLMLESKEEMKKKGFSSPDDGDALACTFAIKVAHRDLKAHRQKMGATRMAVGLDYAIFGR
ncbi:terminase [Candidatus Dojkabacteria bacterium]|uniref:Terminase n=1 Tax=Candidatus Dojkabacteria bacterium TaxID=2099670 RepID=A0A5C7J7T9_9BACT|nr:MAG: terminase [Candidatus Dojkabacteria bacterium]